MTVLAFLFFLMFKIVVFAVACGKKARVSIIVLRVIPF